MTAIGESELLAPAPNHWPLSTDWATGEIVQRSEVGPLQPVNIGHGSRRHACKETNLPMMMQAPKRLPDFCERQ